MNDVEDFLRRVAQMRAEAQAKARQHAQRSRPSDQQPPAAQLQSASSPAVRSSPPTRPVPPLRPPAIEAEIIDAQIADRGNQLDRRTREHLRGAEEIAEHTRLLGDEVDQADDRLQAHLSQVFDHQIGHLRQSGAQAPAHREQLTPEGLSPDSIVNLLRSPGAARDAVILAEILQRPELRW